MEIQEMLDARLGGESCVSIARRTGMSLQQVSRLTNILYRKQQKEKVRQEMVNANGVGATPVEYLPLSNLARNQLRNYGASNMDSALELIPEFLVEAKNIPGVGKATIREISDFYNAQRKRTQESC